MRPPPRCGTQWPSCARWWCRDGLHPAAVRRNPPQRAEPAILCRPARAECAGVDRRPGGRAGAPRVRPDPGRQSRRGSRAHQPAAKGLWDRLAQPGAGRGAGVPRHCQRRGRHGRRRACGPSGRGDLQGRHAAGGQAIPAHVDGDQPGGRPGDLGAVSAGARSHGPSRPAGQDRHPRSGLLVIRHHPRPGRAAVRHRRAGAGADLRRHR